LSYLNGSTLVIIIFGEEIIAPNSQTNPSISIPFVSTKLN
jgi:hypothetical protein